MVLGDQLDEHLPRSWFRTVAAEVLARAGIRMVDQYAVRDRHGVLVAALDLADPRRRVGVTAADQHHAAHRRDVLRQLGWAVVDVSWRDLRRPDRVVAELTDLLASRAPGRRPEPAPPRRP